MATRNTRASSKLPITRKSKLARPDFPAVLTAEQMYSGEALAASHGIARRIALATLTRSSEQMLEELDGETCQALLSAQESIASYLKWREHETEFLMAAQARILAVLAYQDGGKRQ